MRRAIRPRFSRRLFMILRGNAARTLIILGVTLAFGLGGSLRPGAQTLSPAKAGQKPAKGPAMDVTEQLLRLDEESRERFEKAHPGVLPEGPLRARLPMPSAREFNWCTLNEDFFVHDQGQTASCWANSAVEALECNWLIRNGVRHALSPQPILDITRLPNGGMAEQAYDVLLKYGTAAMAEYGFTGRPGKVRTEIARHYRAVAWGQVGGGSHPIKVEDMKAALLEHGPLVVNLFVTPALQKYQKGVFAEHYEPGKNEPPHNHEVLLLGWDDRKGHGAWWIKNSWGEKWGERGYCWIEYGCNNVCWDAWWVKAQSTYYTLPKEQFLGLLPGADPPTVWSSPVNPVGMITAVRLEPDASQDGKPGILFKISADVGRAMGKQVRLIVFIDDQDGNYLRTTHADYATRDGYLHVRTVLKPDQDRCSFKDVPVFLPYEVLPEGGARTSYRFHVDMSCDKHWLCLGNVYQGTFEH